ncbi:MAG: cyclase family protein [Gammaproteobacteria bacterium]|nr:cyclase family protein [Gammaproteobacteria bacterium]
MSSFSIEIDNERITTEGGALDISIPLAFDGEQPNFYDAEAASTRPMHSGEFIGDTRLGGSCNADHVSLIAHVNGTHTECVGHITQERVSIHRLVTAPLYRCTVITAPPESVADSDEHGGPIAEVNDVMITRKGLEESGIRVRGNALAIRTLPNPTTKTTRVYKATTTPYFSVEAMQWIVDNGIDHLLVDTPSVDRLIDDGRLTTHRMFWGLGAGDRSVTAASRPKATITELIYIPDEIKDGHYLLDLQIAPFISDAAPSRPLLHRIAT